MEKISKNFFLLGNFIDQFPNTPHLIRENRVKCFFNFQEILSQSHLEKFNEHFPLKISNNFENLEKIQKNKKSKQQKIKWTPEEHKIFLEGINKFGPKSKNSF